MARKSLDELNINESNIQNVAIVRDENEFVCNTEHLVPASEVDEGIRSQCVRKVPGGEDTK